MKNIIPLLLFLSSSISAQYNFFPVQEGDTLHYFHLWSVVEPHYSWADSSYYKEVVTSTTVDSFTYYKVRDYYYNYNQNEQKLYTLINGVRKLAVDFNIPSGNYFMGNLMDWPTLRFISQGIQSQTFDAKWDSSIYGQRQDSKEIMFQNNLGFKSYLYGYFIPTPTGRGEADTWSLIEARGHAYSYTFQKPLLNISAILPFKIISEFPFNISFTKIHRYPQLIDSLYLFIKVYRGNNLIISKTTTPSTSNSFPVNLSPGELNPGDVINLSFVMSDTSLARNHIRLPADGSDYKVMVIGTVSNKWFLQNPYPTGNTLSTFDNKSPGILWAGGELGTIKRTTDNGNTWDDISIGEPENNIFSLSFPEINTGYAISETNIFKTTDGGTTWSKNQIGTGYLGKTAFATPIIGSIIGKDKVYTTSNGGVNWTPVVNANYSYRDIGYINSNVGFIARGWETGGGIMRTTDGGVNWANITSYPNALNDLCIVNDTLAFASGDYLFRTVDHGNSWTRIGYYHPSTMSAFFDINTGFSLYNGKLEKSTDGGILWSQVNTNFPYLYTSVRILDNNTVLLFGEKGLIVKSTDRGESWLTVSRGYSNTLYGSFLFNENIGYAVGIQGTILQTTNGGSRWNKVSTPTSETLTGVFFPNLSTGIVVGRHGVILRTTDAGAYWNIMPSGTTSNLNGVCFINDNIGYIAGASIILKTTDGGLTWSPKAFSQIFNGISFTDVNTGTAVGDNGIIFRTSDGGTNWFAQASKTSSNLYSVDFIDALKGIAVGDGTIMKTSDGGTTWTNFENKESVIFKSAKYVDQNKIIVVGNNGIILSSSDGGSVWAGENMNIGKKLYNVSVSGSNNIIVGEDGIIYSNKNVPLGIVNEMINANEGKEFKLSQNYPNPFNPVTKIKYSVHSPQHIKIAVYDILGKEVSILVDEVKQPGVHEVEFNASNLASGIYFYRLRSAESSETRKMVLLR